MNDPINPQHYKTESGLEAIDVIEGFGLNFHRGNAFKYLARAGRKDACQGHDRDEGGNLDLHAFSHVQLG